jgi:fos-like antigen, invertebrate
MIPAFLDDATNSMTSYDSSESSWQTPPPTVMDEVISSSSNGKGRPRTNYANSNAGSTPQKKRNVGGRKPNRPTNLSPEEEEKRRVRRERNKQAAARCRRRREDHTHELQKQVDDMEEKKRQLTVEYTEMCQLRDELYEMIEEHKRQNGCVIGDRSSPSDVKPNVALNGKIVAITTSVAGSIVPPVSSINRPNSFTTALSNNNNNNTLNANNKLALKIKAEPLEFYDDEPPTKRRCGM